MWGGACGCRGWPVGGGGDLCALEDGEHAITWGDLQGGGGEGGGQQACGQMEGPVRA